MKQVKCRFCKSMNVKYRGIRKYVKKKNDVRHYRQYICTDCKELTEINPKTNRMSERDALILKNRKEAQHDARVRQNLTPPMDLKPFEKKKNKGLVRRFKDLFKRKVKK